MAQPPWKIDALEIVGDSGLGSRLIEEGPDGSFRFTDNQIPGGVALYELAGLQRLGGVIVCGKSGSGRSKDADGNEISTLQAANDAVPLTTSNTNPWVVLVGPGLYIEDVILDRDWVTYIALGDVTLRNATAGASLTVAQGILSTPERVTLKGLRIENTAATGACVALTSATFAGMTINVAVVPFVGDTLTAAGVPLAAISAGAVPAAGQFELGATVAETAANLAQAINDPANGLTPSVKAYVLGATIHLRALALGTAGNGITVATSVPATLALSSATTVGGLDVQAGSEVGAERISILDCDLVPTGVTGFQVDAEAINTLFIEGGNWEGSSSGSTLRVRDCASLEVASVSGVVRVETHYDTANPLPAGAGSSYRLRNFQIAGNASADLTGDGTLQITGCTYLSGTTLTLSGDQTVRADFTRFDSLVLGETLAMDTRGCSRGTLTANPGSPTFTESLLRADLPFAASASETYFFDVPQPDTDYSIALESQVVPAAVTDIPHISLKAADRFVVTFGGPQTTTLGFTVTRT